MHFSIINKKKGSVVLSGTVIVVPSDTARVGGSQRCVRLFARSPPPVVNGIML